ncbi:MAG: Fic family protein [Clostridia bacterium]|nr:Fic family protein [Clostridia bacterium]
MSDYVPPFHLTEEIAELGIEIGELLGTLSVSADLSADPRLRRETRIRSIYSSLAIEQNTLSLDQVTDVINGRPVLGPPKDIREVQNAYEVYERMASFDPCSMEDLLIAHRLMMTDLVREAGCFRSGDVGVFSGGRLIHAGTPAAYVPEVMGQLFEWLRTTTLHPLIKSSIFHCEFEFIHPFADGNGRTGRFWQTLILQKWKPVFAWIPVESIIHERQGEYYQALNAASSKGECTGFVAFMLTAIRDTMKRIITAQQAHVGEDVGDHVGENVGEMSVIAILKRMPKASANTIAEMTHLSSRQIERILARLKQEGRIARHGSARNGYWEVIDTK